MAGVFIFLARIQLDTRVAEKNCPAAGASCAESGHFVTRTPCLGGVMRLGPPVGRKLEAGWVFFGYVEVTLQSQADAGDSALVEEAADEGYAVRDAVRWVELW
jgi:hypothetical protein